VPEPAAFELLGAGVRYRDGEPEALRDVDLRVDAGGLTAVLGPNGAGKTTLVRLLTGVLEPTRGEARFLDRPLAKWPRRELARRLAVVTQEPPPAVPLTVREYVALGRTPYMSPWSAPGPAERALVARTLERTGLGPLERRPVSDLSGGERQRAKLARALAQEPEVLVLDEPTAHLDLGHALWVFDAMRELVMQQGITVLCITHDMNLASRRAERLVLIGRGRVLADGAPRDVLVPPVLEAAYGGSVEVHDLGASGLAVLPTSFAGPGARGGPAV